MPKASLHRNYISGRNIATEGFRQGKQYLVTVAGDGGPIDVEARKRPNAAQSDTSIAEVRVDDNGRTEHVSTKLTDDHRRRLRIHFVGSSFCRYRINVHR